MVINGLLTQSDISSPLHVWASTGGQKVVVGHIYPAPPLPPRDRVRKHMIGGKWLQISSVAFPHADQ